MEMNAIEKNTKLNKELNSTDDIMLKVKIFNFYYYILRKKDINMFLCVLFLFLETLQLISYAFTTPHKSSWKIESTVTMDYIELAVGAPRITPLMKFLQFDYFIIIYAILLGYVFLNCVFISMIVKFNKTTSKFYQMGVAFTRYFTTPLTIFLMIPISELILLPLKCTDGKVAIVTNPIACFANLHYLYVVLSIVFTIVFYFFIILCSIFYFDPFNSKKTTTKIDTTADSFLYFCKMILVIRFIAIANEYISIVVMVIAALFNLKRGFENPTYNNAALECVLSIRNAAFFWTYLVLLIAKLAEGSKINGTVYLLLFGYPLIITASIIYYRKQSQSFMIKSSNFNDSNEFLVKVKYMIRLIESFLSKNKSGKSNKSNTCKKNEILLKGIITIHEETCVTEECPLKKFLENMNNFSIQKTCLLHYMNILFAEGIKKFPNLRILLMIFVQFNYDKKYNLNAAKTYLTKLEKQKNSLTEDYIIYCIKQNITSNNNKMNMGLGDNEEMMRIEDTIETKYRRLKILVETSTKFYGEFWGILATNLTNNLNLNKLFLIGNKLNKFLNEINQLWENDLKNKKIDLENQSIAQLYAYFSREILKNKKRSEEITKKLNEEQHYESRKNDSDKFDIDNLDIILENQDYMMYCRTNEKGECNIIQCSNSIVYLLGFTKQELIAKTIETIMPTVYAGDHAKMLSQRIKVIRSSLSTYKDNFRSTDKKQIFILPKTKVGYLIPINARFTVYNDDDFSNTYIIKAKFEGKDTKSIYAFYILTKDDFTVDSISSSAINLGLSMDLLKKYVINMNVLVRNENNTEALSLAEKYVDYEEEPKKVTWVFPDIIYPKNDSQRSKEETHELIKNSKTKEYLLLITKMKYNEEETLGYCFRFTDIENLKGNNDANDFQYSKTKHILFDLFRLNYVRTVLVNAKSQNHQELRPLMSHSSTINNEMKKDSLRKEGKTKKKKDTTPGTNNDEYSDEEEPEQKKIENSLTREKIQELQPKSSDEVKNFIFGLPFFGNDISLEKHRPTKEKYSFGKAQEPEIKITIVNFIKRIEEKLKTYPDKRHENKTASSSSEGATSSSISTYQSLNSSSSESSFNSAFSTDASASLSNIFNEKSITYINIFSLIAFFVICGIISAEFAISLTTFQDSSARMGYMDKGFIILNSLMYTKFFVTEIILTQYENPSGPAPPITYLGKDIAKPDDYIRSMMTEMSSSRETFSNTYSFYSNATVTFSAAYQNYTASTQVNIVTLSNEQPTIEHQPFSTAMSRIPTSIFYVSTVTDDPWKIDMKDRNAYELMMNLLNDYFLVWRNVTFLLVDDVKTHTVSNNSLVFIFGFSFLISAVSLIGFWKLIKRFINDREKPVDLFLTIKKQIFEDLKNSSESFINKLLNKFFGNEETEEESMIDYSTNIKAEDININKLKSKNDYKQSFRTSSAYLLNYVKLIIFFIIIEAYMAFKYFYNKDAMKNMNQYTEVFNITHYSQSDIILSLNIAKSFFYNKDINITNSPSTEDIFKSTFIDLSNSFESLLIISYSTPCFLSGNYIKQLYSGLNNDITSLVTGSNNENEFGKTLPNGFKATISRFFELVRFIGITYFKNKEKPDPTYTHFWNMIEFKEINNIVKNVIRPWYANILNLINKEFSDYINSVKLINISTFIVLLVCVILLYCFVWKSYEQNLRELLKTSVDLINLIPEEIKCQIVQKLNEEESKNE